MHGFGQFGCIHPRCAKEFNSLETLLLQSFTQKCGGKQPTPPEAIAGGVHALAALILAGALACIVQPQNFGGASHSECNGAPRSAHTQQNGDLEK